MIHYNVWFSLKPGVGEAETLGLGWRALAPCDSVAKFRRVNDAKLISAALKLPVRKRDRVAEAPIASIKSPSQAHINRLWAQESETRIDALLAGQIKTVRGEKVLQYRARK